MGERPLSSLEEELLETLEGIVHFADGFACYRRDGAAGRALGQWLASAEALIEKHRAAAQEGAANG
jgi:hypothetical protein